MSGLITKDLLSLKKYLKTTLAVIIIYCIWGYTMNNPLFLGSFISLLFVMLIVNSFAYDETAKWNEYGLTLPLKKNSFIYSKYVLSIFFMLGGTLISAISMIVFFLIKNEPLPTTELTSNIVVSLFLSTFYISLIIPITVKLGIEKSRFTSVAIFLVPVIIVFMGAKLLPANLIPSEAQVERLFNLLSSYSIIVTPVIIALLLSISCFITCKIFSKKEY